MLCLPNGECVIKKIPTLMCTVILLQGARALQDRSSATVCTHFVLLCYQAIVMIEEVEMKNNHMKTRQNLQYDQFVPHREQHSCCDEKDPLATVVLVHGCSLLENCTQSTGNPVRRVLGSVLVDIYPVILNELFIWKIIIMIIIIIIMIIIIKNFHVQYFSVNFSKNGSDT